mmetsp:Transcript_47953/g.158927  ORF Transcript_47953/g.158927 Transcript_47953/m.158927 type:complete len:213 (-) Transcript_47953:1060-1698(-)
MAPCIARAASCLARAPFLRGCAGLESSTSSSQTRAPSAPRSAARSYSRRPTSSTRSRCHTTPSTPQPRPRSPICRRTCLAALSSSWSLAAATSGLGSCARGTRSLSPRGRFARPSPTRRRSSGRLSPRRTSASPKSGSASSTTAPSLRRATQRRARRDVPTGRLSSSGSSRYWSPTAPSSCTQRTMHSTRCSMTSTRATSGPRRGQACLPRC